MAIRRSNAAPPTGARSPRLAVWLIGLALALPAAAPALADAALEARLRERIDSYVREQSPGTLSEIEVPSLARFDVSTPSERVRVEVESSGHSTRPDRIPLRVSLWDSNKRRLLKRGVVQVDVAGERAVVVTRNALRSGALIASDDLEIELRPLSAIRGGVFDAPEGLIGQRLRRGVGRGAVLTDAFVEQPPLVERGQRLKIRVGKGPLRIEMVGRAQEEGRAGDWIRALNDRSKQEIVGRVGEDGVLHVGL